MSNHPPYHFVIKGLHQLKQHAHPFKFSVNVLGRSILALLLFIGLFTSLLALALYSEGVPQVLAELNLKTSADLLQWLQATFATVAAPVLSMAVLWGFLLELEALGRCD